MRGYDIAIACGGTTASEGAGTRSRFAYYLGDLFTYDAGHFSQVRTGPTFDWTRISS